MTHRDKFSWALSIDPFAGTIAKLKRHRDRLFEDDFPGGACIGWRYRNGDVLYVDDEGLLVPCRGGFRVRSRPDGQPMLSKGLLIGREIDHGDDYHICNVGMTEKEALQEFLILTREQALLWFQTQRDQPAMTLNGQPVAYWRDILGVLERPVDARV